MRLWPRVVSILLFVIASFLAGVEQAGAASFVVTRGDDPTPGICNVGDCSLREAVMAANSAPGSTITVPAGTYTLTIPGTDDAITNPAIGDIDILAAMTITGAGVGSTFVQSGLTPQSGIHRIFDNSSAGATVISGMTIRNGYINPAVDSSSGGCIRNIGVLTLNSVVVTGCLTRIGGGGISSFHTLTIINSTITANAVDNLTGAAVNGGGVAGGAGGIVNPSTVNIINSVISNNVVASAGNVDLTALGGGFANTATMTITGSLISGNTALNVGGGINTGIMTIQGTTFAGNKARYDVGGVDNDATMTINDSTFSGNIAGFGCVGTECDRAFAGGVLNTDGGTMFVNNTTFSGNTCLVSGGGFLNALGTVTMSSTTITGNTCGLGAGLAASDIVNVKNTIIGANTATDPTGGDVSATAATFISQGYNLIQNTTGSLIGGNTTGNITGVNPDLGTLQFNGGPTFTHALNPGSPAFNAGNPAGCLNHAGALLAADQRGNLRASQGRCDMGAYDLAPSVVLWSSSNVAQTWLLNGGSFAGQVGFGGPGISWTPQSYFRNPNESYYLLWTIDNLAHLWSLNANNTFAGALGFLGPGAGWTATSYFRNTDGSYHLLWAADNLAHIWTLNANNTFGGAFGLGGPGPGWKATSYFRARDGSHRVLWTSNNVAQVWTITPALGFGGAVGLGGPGSGWTATSFHLNGDGSFNVVWTSTNAAAIWTLNSGGGFVGALGLGGPGAAYTVQSFFK